MVGFGKQKWRWTADNIDYTNDGGSQHNQKYNLGVLCRICYIEKYLVQLKKIEKRKMYNTSFFENSIVWFG